MIGKESPMKALLLLRHAKTSRDNPTVSDSLRPLSATGKDNVCQIGKFLKIQNYFLT